MKKIIFSTVLLLSLTAHSQNIYSPTMYTLNDGKHNERKILKVSNDSIYILYANVAHSANASIALCNLQTGKLLNEVKLNGDLFYSVPNSENRTYTIRNENNNIIVFSGEEENHKLIIHKNILNPDLTVTKLKESFSLPVPDKREYTKFDISTKENFYIFSFYNRESSKLQRNQSTQFLCVVTLDKKLNMIDSSCYSHDKFRGTTYKKPDAYNSYSILHQLNLGGVDECIAEKILFKADDKGKIKKFRSKELTNYDNFIFEKDSAGKTYGYCLNYLNPDKKNVDVAIVKFCLDLNAGKFTILNPKLASKTIVGRHLKDIETQTLFKNGKFHLLLNTLTMANSDPLFWNANSASYYIFENDILQTTHYLSLNTQGTNPEQVYVNIKMQPVKNSVFMCYNDDMENANYNTSVLSEEEPTKARIDIFGKPHPAFFKVLEAGHLQKNYSFNKDEERSYLEPDGIWVDKNENIFIPYSTKRNSDTKIIKIIAGEE